VIWLLDRFPNIQYLVDLHSHSPGEDHDINCLHDRVHLSRGEDLMAQSDALLVTVGAQENHAEVDQDVRSAPFASVHPGKKADRRTLPAVARADAEGVATALLPGQMRKWDALEDLGMVFLAHHDRGLDLVDGEVPAAPDHVAVASPLEAGLRRGTAFSLSRATRGLDLLEELDAIALLPEPVDALGGDVGVNNDAAAGLLGTYDDHPELVPKLGQVTPIAAGNGDVE
jgi:hypothetical protein